MFPTGPRHIALLVGLAVVGASRVSAQNADTAKPARAPFCARGVRIYTDKSQVPVPNDTLRLPPADGPVRVTSPEEAEAAELALRGRAASVGANALLITDVMSESNGEQRMRRSVVGLFVRADSARSALACK